MGIQSKPCSARLKHKRKAEGETVIKQIFVEDIKESNRLLQLLGEGLPVVLQPQSSAVFSLYSRSRIGCLIEAGSRSHLTLTNQNEAVANAENNLAARYSNDAGSNPGTNCAVLSSSITGKLCSLPADRTRPNASPSNEWDCEYENNNARVSNQKLFSCVTCGILCFTCVAIIQPTEGATRALMLSDCDLFSKSTNATNIVSEGLSHGGRGVNTLNLTDSSGKIYSCTCSLDIIKFDHIRLHYYIFIAKCSS